MIEIKEEQQETHFAIAVIGEVDASSSIHLDNALQKALKLDKSIVVDLSNLEYISSAGLGVFISYIEEIKNKGISMVLYGLKTEVTQVFEILGLHNLIAIEETKEEALTRINES